MELTKQDSQNSLADLPDEDEWSKEDGGLRRTRAVHVRHEGRRLKVERAVSQKDFQLHS